MINNIFFPYYLEKLKEVERNCFKFVQYTSASSAMSIIKNKEVWLRNTRCMNDYSEIEHGLNNLIKTYNGKAGEKLKSLLNEFFPNITTTIETQFNGWIPYFKNNTFITCISEHPPEENKYGRLSMWRAYGGNNAVAIVLNINPFITESDIFHAYTSPVAYIDHEKFPLEMESLADRIEKNKTFFKTLTEEQVISSIFVMFKGVALCVKHPGFKEEREWRVVYNPKYQKSEHVKSSIEVINGVPQEIHKIPLKNFPESNFTGVSIPDFVDRIIIGPNSQQEILAEAFTTILGEAGCKNPQDRIYYSGIPLRG